MSKPVELNRRRLLLGLASASAAGAAVALAGAAVVTAAADSATLMRLGDELPTLEASYLAALAEKRAAYNRAMKHWPLAPDVLIRNYSGHDALERDVAGVGIRRDDGRSANLWTVNDARGSVELLRHAIERPRKDPKLPFGVGCFVGKDTAEGWRDTLAACEARLQAAEAYYTKTTRLLERSGYQAAAQADEAARETLVAHIGAIMAETPTTMAGVVIHAQALAAFNKVEKFFRVTSVEAWPWAGDFAAAVLRIAEEAPAKQV